MIACLIGADWGEERQKDGKEDHLLMLKKIEVGEFIRHMRLYNPICSLKSGNTKVLQGQT